MTVRSGLHIVVLLLAPGCRLRRAPAADLKYLSSRQHRGCVRLREAWPPVQIPEPRLMSLTFTGSSGCEPFTPRGQVACAGGGSCCPVNETRLIAWLLPHQLGRLSPGIRLPVSLHGTNTIIPVTVIQRPSALAAFITLHVARSDYGPQQSHFGETGGLTSGHLSSGYRAARSRDATTGSSRQSKKLGHSRSLEGPRSCDRESGDLRNLHDCVV